MSTPPSNPGPRAVTRRIGDRDLWIGNVDGAQPEHLETLEQPPDYVVSVNGHPTEATTDHHPLQDGIVNDQQEFNAAVETARKRYRQSGSVLVNCAAGISRSTTVIATALAVEEDRSFKEAVRLVQQYRERASPHPLLRINAYSYLVREDGRPGARTRLETLADEYDSKRTEVTGALDQIGFGDKDNGD